MGIFDARSLAEIDSENRNSSRHVHALSTLADVARTEPTNTAVLKYDTTKRLWTPGAIAVSELTSVAWTAWTPVFSFNLTTCATTNLDATYTKVGRLVVAHCAFTKNATAATGALRITLPIAPRTYASGQQAYMRPIGHCSAITIPGGLAYEGVVRYDVSSGLAYVGSTATAPSTSWSNTVPVAWGSDDFHFTLTYESAT